MYDNIIASYRCLIDTFLLDELHLFFEELNFDSVEILTVSESYDLKFRLGLTILLVLRG